MINFQNNVSIVLQTINRYRYGPRAIKLSAECYTGLLLSMKKGDVNHFSLEYSLEWCLKEVAKCKQSQYKYSILRLADVYEHGKVMANHLIIYRHPSEYYQQHISDYISTISASGCYKQTHLSNIQDAVEQFCCFIEYQGILKIEDLGYPALEQYDSFLRESSDAFFITEGLVSGFLNHLADRNICNPGYGLFMHYVESSKCLSYNDLSQNAISDIDNLFAD